MRLRKIEAPSGYVHGCVQEWSHDWAERSLPRVERPSPRCHFAREDSNTWTSATGQRGVQAVSPKPTSPPLPGPMSSGNTRARPLSGRQSSSRLYLKTFAWPAFTSMVRVISLPRSLLTSCTVCEPTSTSAGGRGVWPSGFPSSSTVA